MELRELLGGKLAWGISRRDKEGGLEGVNGSQVTRRKEKKCSIKSTPTHVWLHSMIMADAAPDLPAYLLIAYIESGYVTTTLLLIPESPRRATPRREATT